MSDYITKLQKAIRDLHGCESQYLETVPVKEMFQDKIVWEGDVEVFQIRGHPKANRAFAWSHVAGANDQQTGFITVLELPPVDSPETAVKAAIMSEIQNAREKENRR